MKPLNFISRFRFTCEPWHYGALNNFSKVELSFHVECDGEVFSMKQVLDQSDDESFIDIVFDSAKRSLVEAIRKKRKEKSK